ncbi:sugar transferase [Fonticella tunisiensis]|uniref:Exopolysaccharide biosynthesis polyprenyl glycosylphosphotransferase n=1 Tax=Fonticella tunisiensis TaxID=1096341 RepID=A0A4R7KAS9_9CLOT|nr:sugar transferase [Fonticella tunisiensis]TDT50823.1 exopolysaccharide biosynthesis polyprenyl glycosylphosphotransferase [Fonticella tunisiensis]
MKRETFVTGLYEIGVFLMDIFLILFAIYLSYMVMFNFNPPKVNYVAFEQTAPFIVIFYLLFAYVFGMGDILKQSLGEMIYSAFLTIISLFIVTMAITFFIRAFAYPRSVLIISTIFQMLFISLWRAVVWKTKRLSHGRKPTIVIGNLYAEKLAKKLIMKQRDIYDIKYICDPSSKNLWDYIDKSEVIFVCEDVDSNLRNEIIKLCIDERKSLYIIPRMYEIGLINSKMDRVDDVPVLKIRKMGLTVEERIIKRLMDIIISLIGIIIALPFMAIVMILILLEDGAPVFYKQERVTEGERRFNIIKFRTMVKDAEKLSGPVLAGENDPRITRVGKFIRATRLDELPQLFNILVGDMSVVGPRPERPFFVEQFKKEIPDYKYRTLVKAGLTGLAQVLGKYNTTAEDKVKYDILYIKKYSIFLDIMLILQTIKIMFIKESTEGLKDDLSMESLLKDLNLEITIDKDDN